MDRYILDLSLPIKFTMVRIRLWQFNLHRMNAANKALVIRLFFEHKVPKRKPTYLLLYHSTVQATRWEISYWM